MREATPVELVTEWKAALGKQVRVEFTGSLRGIEVPSGGFPRATVTVRRVDRGSVETLDIEVPFDTLKGWA